jgi:hypothetical protein
MLQLLARLGLPVTAVAFGTSLLLQSPRSAFEGHEQIHRAISALAREMSTCSGFFALAASVLGRALPDKSAVVQRYDLASKALMAQATAVAEMIGIDPDVAIEWSRVAMQDMVKEINADPKGSAALMMSKYDEPCQTLLRDSVTRLRALMEPEGAD